MNKPNNYDQTQEQGSFTPIELGGHKLVIMDVKEENTSSGKPYIKVSFDTTADDRQPNYYSKSYKADTRDNKKWSGVTTVFVNDIENPNTTSRAFKTFCTSVEKSNAGFKIVWGDGFCAALKGKKVGGVFREEEYLDYYQQVKKSHKLAWFRSIDGVENAETPKAKTISAPATGTAPSAPESFMAIPDSVAEELPFN